MAMATTKTSHEHHHHHHQVIKDIGLMNKLTNVWLSVIVLAFGVSEIKYYSHQYDILSHLISVPNYSVLDAGSQYFNGETLLPRFSFSFAPTDMDGTTWKHLESHGDVELLYRTIVPTPALHAHRAVVEADIPIEALLHVFRDTPHMVSNTKSWNLYLYPYDICPKALDSCLHITHLVHCRLRGQRI